MIYDHKTSPKWYRNHTIYVMFQKKTSITSASITHIFQVVWCMISIPILIPTLCCGEVVTTLRPDMTWLKSWKVGPTGDSIHPKWQTQNILRSMWIHEDPIIHLIYWCFSCFFILDFNSSIPPVTAPFGEKLRTKKAQQSVTTWLVGWCDTRGLKQAGRLGD